MVPRLLCLPLLLLVIAAKPPPLGPNELPNGGSSAPLPAAPEPPPGGTGAVRATGSGFVVAPGRLLTNAHVVRGCSGVLARNASRRVARARLVRVDADRDLALLGVPEGFGPPLAFRDGPELRLGEGVVTYGFPLSGLLSSGPTLTTGGISALSGLRDSPVDLTISAPVQPGNSGGPLLDMRGHVVGVVVAKLNALAIARMTGGDIPQNVNFAIRGEVARAFLSDAGVTPNVAPSDGVDLRASDVGAVADPSAAFLQCLR